MKLTMDKRIVMIVHSILSLLLCVALALGLIVPGVMPGILSGLKSSLGNVGFLAVGIALVAIYALLSVVVLTTAFKRDQKHGDREFIEVDSDGSGRVRIAVSAIEQMVRQSVRNIDGINEMKINIDGLEEAIAITVDAVVVSGSHVPTLTGYMQHAIRQFVESNCGVAVSGVMISINAVAPQPKGVRHGIGARKKADKATEPAPSFREMDPERNTPPVDEAQKPIPEGEPGEESAIKTVSYVFDEVNGSEYDKDQEAFSVGAARDVPEVRGEE